MQDALRLELQQVSFRYSDRGAFALQDIDLTIQQGEFLGIIGHTGSGKSTLVQLFNGLLKPTQGAVLLDGEDLRDKAVLRQARQRIGLVFQRPERQLFAATVEEDVAYGPRNFGLEEDEVGTRVQEALASVGLDYATYAHRPPLELSGGEKRRVAFAGVIASHPDLLVLDEPTAGLDPQAASSLMGVVQGLYAQGAGIVMVSHSMEDIARYCHRILVLNEGRTFLMGTPRQVFAHHQELRRINLGLPGATSFALSLNERGFHLPDGLFTTEALADAIAAELLGMDLSSSPERHPEGDGLDG